MKKKSPGFTLVETIMAVAVIAIVMYAVIAIYITSGIRGVNVEVFTVAQSLAEGKLEESMAQTFEALSSVGQTGFSQDLSDYSYRIAVNYVSAEALDTPVASVTEYKKIQVKIRHPKLGNPTQLESLRADF